MTDTTTRNLRASLAAVDAEAARYAAAGYHGTDEYVGVLERLAETVRAELAPMPDTTELAAEAERAARTMAPPVPGITQNAGCTVRDVIYTNPAGDGLLESWWVAAEDAERGTWVTWLAYAQDGRNAGQLAYTWGHYDGLDSRAAALRDLAERAGIR